MKNFIVSACLVSVLALSVTSFAVAAQVTETKLIGCEEDPRVIQIAKAVYAVGYTNKARGLVLARIIASESARRDLEPSIMVAILMQESSFKSGAVNKKSRDFSVAQINKRVWVKEYKRMGHAPIDFKRLMVDDRYAIAQMAEILSILADRFSDKDDWYLRYHSSNKKEKQRYRQTINRKLLLIAVM
jgi:predicted GH43/DUF377 family glycosyl hydrolase